MLTREEVADWSNGRTMLRLHVRQWWAKGACVLCGMPCDQSYAHEACWKQVSLVARRVIVPTIMLNRQFEVIDMPWHVVTEVEDGVDLNHVAWFKNLDEKRKANIAVLDLEPSTALPVVDMSRLLERVVEHFGGDPDQYARHSVQFHRKSATLIRDILKALGRGK